MLRATRFWSSVTTKGALSLPTGRSYTKDFIHVVTLRDNKVIKFREYVASDDMYDAFAGK